MKTMFKRILSLLLVLVMFGSMLPAVYADSKADGGAENVVKLTEEDYAIVDDVFAQIDAMEDAPAKKSASKTQITDAAIEIVKASENYVEGSLERNGDSFTWWTEEGIRCIYNPYMREKYENMQAPENPEPAGIYNEPKTTKGGWPTGNQVYLIAPYYGLDDSFTDQYKNEAKAIASAIGDSDGYTLYSGKSCTIDNVADAIENGAVVIFDSHGTTDYDGSYVCNDPDGYEVYDYVSQAKYSYLCLTNKTGVTTADYNAGAAYFVDGDGYTCMCINGAAIANHMDKNSPSGILWMAICLGMATNTMCEPMRAKGVEVVYGYSQSVTFAGDYCFEETFWDNMIAGNTVADSVAAMKAEWGNWDWSEPIAAAYGYSGSGYTLSEARKYRSAFPVVVSDEDAHPGQRDSGTNYGACSEQTVKSTYTLFNQYEVTVQSNNTAYGTASVSGNTITAKPATGYFAEGYTVVSGTASVTQNGNTFSVSAGSDCVIQINFAPKTVVSVTFSGANVAGQTGYAGDSMTLPAAAAPEGYQFVGWTTAPLSGDTTDKPAYYTSSFVPNGNTTLYALYSYQEESSSGSGDYVKVTSTLDDWSGEYLIVYEDKGLILNSFLASIDVSGNHTTVTITDNTISAEDGDPYKFTIASMSGGYSILGTNGKYIGGTSGSNKLNASDSPIKNTITIDANGNADIVSNTSHLRYNASDNRFRYYKSSSYSSQKAIALYVKDGTASITYYTSSLCDHENKSEVEAIAATCTEVGYTYGIQCDDCGSFVSGHEIIPALGHSWGDWSVTTQPTCTASGVQSHICGNCGETETQSVAATGHNMDSGEITTAATCTTNGVLTYTCANCGTTGTESIPATGHSYVANGLTYTCSGCGDTYTAAANTELHYVFSAYAAGTQYAQGEDHELDDIITLTINGAHLNTQIRLYAGSNAVFSSAKFVESIIVKAGYKAGTLNVYSSSNGTDWDLVASKATTTTYTNYSFEIPSGCKYVMLEAVGAQVRVSEMTIVVSEIGGTVEPEPSEPTEPENTEPEITEPEITEPEITEPEITEPGTPELTALQYVFSEYPAGTAGAVGEVHQLDDVITMTVNNGYLTSMLRLYANGGNAVFASQKVIDSIIVEAGYKVSTLTVYGSTDGATWTMVKEISTTTTQTDYVVAMPAGANYTYLMLEAGVAQVRIPQMTIHVLDAGSTECTHANETAVVTAPTCTAEGYTTYFCADCGVELYVEDYVAALGHSYVDGVCGTCGEADPDYKPEITPPTGEAELKVRGASLTLGADLKVVFLVRMDTIRAFENVHFVFEIAGKTITLDEYTVSTDGKNARFYMPGVAPRMMNDEISINLYGTYQGQEFLYTNTYKAADYCYSQLGKNNTAALKTLIVDLLNFGTQHQIYKSYNLSNPINGKLTDAQKALGSNYETTYNNIQAMVGTDNGASFKGAALSLNDAVEVRYHIECADLTGVQLKVTVAGTTSYIDAKDFVPTGTTNRYYAYFKTLPAKMMREAITTVVLRDGVEISRTATYSVESYTASKINDASLGALVKAMMYYGDSAKKVLG